MVKASLCQCRRRHFLGLEEEWRSGHSSDSIPDIGTVDVLCSHEGFIPETGLGFRSFCPAEGSIPHGGYFLAAAPSLLGRLPRKAHIRLIH